MLRGRQGRVLPSCSTSALSKSCALWSWKSGFLSDLVSVPAVQRSLLVWIQGGSLHFLRMQRTFFFSCPHITMGLHLSPQSTGCFTLPQLCSLVFLRRKESGGMPLTLAATPLPQALIIKGGLLWLPAWLAEDLLSPSVALLRKAYESILNSPWVKSNHGLFTPVLPTIDLKNELTMLAGFFLPFALQAIFHCSPLQVSHNSCGVFFGGRFVFCVFQASWMYYDPGSLVGSREGLIL